MSTPIDLTTDVYLGPGGAGSAVLSGGVLVPYSTLSPASIIILAVPVLGAGGSGVIHVTGTFNNLSFGLYSALSADLTGWNDSAYYELLSSPFTTAAAVTQTFDFPFGAGFDQYDDAITNGEPHVALNPSNFWTEITAISYDYTEPGADPGGPLPPIPDPPAYGGGGDVGPPDGGGPSGGVTGGGGPAAPTVGGGYQTTAVRRQSPTTAQVVIDGRWLTGLCPWGDLAWSHVWPGGSGNASWTAEKVPAALRKRGLTVKLMVGAECIWSGIQTEPDPTGATMNAAGLFTIGEDWAALDSSGDATTVPNDAIDAAIVRGMPWLRRDSISTAAVDIDISQGPVTIGQLLDAYALSQTKRWAVDPNGYVYVAADPTTPAWHVLPLDGGLIPADNFATRLLGRYYNGSTYATATVTDDPGNNGIREATVDLTGYGTLTLTKAENRLQSLLDLGLSRPSWASPIVCGYGDILSPGQVPVGLERPVAGDLARVHGHIDETQTRGGRQWTDVLLGQTDVADDTLTLTPMNMPARTLSDVMALAAQTKKGAA